MIFSRRRSLTLIPALAGLSSLGASTASAQPAQPDEDDDPPMPLKMVILDIGGTIIGDHGEVPDAMLGAFSRHGITVSPQEFSEWRGAAKRGMVQHCRKGSFKTGRALLEGSRRLRHRFQSLCQCARIPGAEQAMKELQAMAIRHHGL